MLGVSKSYEISCHLADNREDFMSRMGCIQPIDHGRNEPHSLLYVTVVKMNASRYYNHICSYSYLFLAGGIIMKNFSKTTFLQSDFANCEAH